MQHNIPDQSKLQTDLMAALEQGDHAMMVSQPPISFHRIFVDLTGSTTAALLLSACFQDQEYRGSSDSWYTASAAGWEALTGLSRKEQSTARMVLRDLHLVQERRTGYPAQFEVKVDYNEITRRMLALVAKKRQRSNAGNTAVSADRKLTHLEGVC